MNTLRLNGMKNIRVLLIPSSDYIGHPFPQRYNHIFERLHREGIEVHVIRFSLSPPRLRTSTILHKIKNEIKVLRNIPLYYLANIVQHNIEVPRIVKENNIDIVVASNLSPLYITTIINELSSNGIPLIFDLQDYYPLSVLGTTGNIFFQKIMYAMTYQMTKILITRSIMVTCASRLLLRFAKRIGAQHVRFIPNGVPSCFFQLRKDQGLELRNQLGLKQTLILGFVGSIEFWLDFEPILCCMHKLYKEGYDVRLILIGRKLYSKYEDKLVETIENYGLKDQVIRLGFISHEKLPNYIAMFDVGLIPFDPNNYLTFFVEEPLKLWEYSAQEIPVLASPIKGIKLYSSKYCFIYHSCDECAKLLKLFIRNRNIFIQRARKARLFAFNYRTWNYIAKLFRRVILETYRFKHKSLMK